MGKLLVVDDDEMMRLCVTVILTSAGYEVVQAGDGEEALRLYQAMGEEILAVVMDVMMPRMDGIMAARLIKASAPGARIILMSGVPRHDLDADLADAFLVKPFRSRELLERVEKAIRD